MIRRHPIGIWAIRSRDGASATAINVGAIPNFTPAWVSGFQRNQNASPVSQDSKVCVSASVSVCRVVVPESPCATPRSTRTRDPPRGDHTATDWMTDRPPSDLIDTRTYSAGSLADTRYAASSADVNGSDMVHADTNSTPPDARTDRARNNTATPNGVNGTARVLDPAAPAANVANVVHVAPASEDHCTPTPCPDGTDPIVTTGGEPCATVTAAGAAGAVQETVNDPDTHGDHKPPACATRTHAL